MFSYCKVALKFKMDAPMIQLKCLTEDVKIIADIIRLLKKSGCCPRCILRFLGEKYQSVYRSTTDEVEALFEFYLQKSKHQEGSPDNSNTTTQTETPDEAADDKSTENIAGTCALCLGILQAFLEKQFINRIKGDIVKADFEFSSYICSLSIPVCIQLREHAMLIYLTEHFSSVYEHRTGSDFVGVKDVWKWRMGPVLASAIGVPFDLKSSFNISLVFTYSKTDKECSILNDTQPDFFQARKFKKGQGERYNQTNISKALKEMCNSNFKKIYQLPPSKPSVECMCKEITCSYDSVYIAGRYNKYSRILSQTPWFLDGQRKSESSVEEKICGALEKAFRYEDHKFSSSGREDVDVKMLGSGRPFVVEMINAHRVVFSPEEIAAQQQEINAATTDVQVRDLQIVSREETNKLKEGEMEKTKVYSALCWCAEPLSQEQLDKLQTMKDVVLKQKTPIRVLHRRPLAVRERTVYKMSAFRQDNHHFTIDLSTQAGTFSDQYDSRLFPVHDKDISQMDFLYIKEFVHGDFGRTKPNLSTILGVECDILELDVKAVELDWPKSLCNI